MEHYKFYKAYTPKTKPELISYTVDYTPIKFNMPKMSSADATIHVAQGLICALKNPAPVSPLFILGNLQK